MVPIQPSKKNQATPIQFNAVAVNSNILIRNLDQRTNEGEELLPNNAMAMENKLISMKSRFLMELKIWKNNKDAITKCLCKGNGRNSDNKAM